MIVILFMFMYMYITFIKPRFKTSFYEFNSYIFLHT